MPAGVENRRYLRLSAMGPVEIVIQGMAAQVAYLASIGRGGFGVYLHQEVHPGLLVMVRMHLLSDHEGGEILKVVGRFRWARAVGQLWMAGCAFEQMSDLRYAQLLKHLKIIESWQIGDHTSEVPSTKVRFSVKE